jgi:anti-sigma regulatory factor (Ser/Thr protein kinase)
LPTHECFNFSAIYVAGRSEALVGGDWYDAFPLIDGRMVVSIGDVEGSGLEAALAMVHVRQTIRALAEIQPDPSVMLAAANRALRAQHPDRHVTAFVGILDPATQRCTYANAGHPPPMVLHPDGRLERAGGRDFPIGVDAGQLLEIHDIAIPERSVMLLYTDGLTEATRDVLAGEARLEAVLAEIEPATCRNVAHAVCERMLSGRAVDDVAVLAITVGPLPTVRRWRFDPKYVELADRVRTTLGEEMRQLGFDAMRAGDIEAVLAELLANAVRHAPGTIELISHCRSDALILHVLDRGPRFSPQFVLPSDLFNEHGRGLFLTRELSDDLVVERRAGSGSHIRVSFYNTKGKP